MSHTLRRMPKSTNIRIDFLDGMTIESITANTFDSHSDAGSVIYDTRRLSIVASSEAAEVTKRSRTDSFLAIEEAIIDDIQEVDEIVPSSKAPQRYNDLDRYTNRGRILPKLHGVPYISVKPTDMPERADAGTPSSTSSTHSTRTTNSSIQTESKFAIGRLSAPSTATHAAPSADETRRTAQELEASPNTSAASNSTRSNTTSSSSNDPPSLTCGCRAVFTSLSKSLFPQKAAARISTIYPLSSGQHTQPTTKAPLRRLSISPQQTHLTTNEAPPHRS